MKKTIYLTALAVTVAFVSACTKESNLKNEELQGGKIVITSLKATLEDCAETKTDLHYFDNGQTCRVYWQGTDKITLMANDGASAEFSIDEGTGTSSATFKGTLSSSTSPFFAIYPSSLGASLEEGSISFTLPQTQAGSVTAANGVMPAVAYIPEDYEHEISFKNICGLFRIKLTGTATIGKLELYDLGGAMLWGDAKLTANSTLSSPSTWKWSLENGDNKLIVDFSGNEKTLSESAMTFYFAVPPGALANGVRVVIYDGDGNAIDEFCTAKDLTVERSHLKPMKSIAVGNYTLLDLQGSANCYIANPSETTVTYKFCEIKGNSNIALTATSAAELWETLVTNTTFNSGNMGYVIDNVSHSAGTVSFKVKGHEGNAIIAASNSESTILWSWHIWLPYSGSVNEVTLGNETVSMDRNLGAKTAASSDASIGFLYQWGRKDPFTAVYHPGNYSTAMTTSPTDAFSSELKEDATTIEWSVQNPKVFIDIASGGKWTTDSDATWAGDSKSMYDPCPPGWRVPAQAHYTGLTFGDWDGTNYRYAESYSSLYFAGTGRRYYSSGQTKHVIESAKIGRYWTRNGGDKQAVECTIDNGKALATANTNKCMGLAVRCVKE